MASARDDIASDDVRGAINALFYAAEAAVVALADANQIETKKSHPLKADAATELHTRGVVDEDFGPLLRMLNQARKDVWYEGDEPDLDGEDIDVVADHVEQLVDAASRASP